MGGQGLEYWGPKGGGWQNSQQAHDIDARFLINQCQISTFLILKPDIIENSSIELKGIVLPVPSNQLKVSLFYPSTSIFEIFSCFT